MIDPVLPHNLTEIRRLRRMRNKVAVVSALLAVPLMFLVPAMREVEGFYVYFFASMAGMAYLEYRAVRVFMRDLRERSTGSVDSDPG